ncbi:myelin protein zero-like protein 1 isoform X2 [Microcaecilia unicolor]|uniref:Myelin protein P0 n=1 Tax=Microcaecilia unicolor TaxID=1415580 RepID=A0A6P7XWJ4_9AMPH|nr:myelin protein zero-like protein 1 isoform X2 [Microcaecilia unicolor]
MWRVGLVRLCAFSWALKLAFVFTVKAIEVYTPKELIVENGTQAKLPCTFKTSEVVSSSTAVTWIFKPEGGGRSFTFFYYTSGRHFMDVAPFKDRVSWAGDLNKKDASIYIKNMQFQDNGTYFCDLKNPPDIDATVTGEIQLKVVEKGPGGRGGGAAGGKGYQRCHWYQMWRSFLRRWKGRRRYSCPDNPLSCSHKNYLYHLYNTLGASGMLRGWRHYIAYKGASLRGWRKQLGRIYKACRRASGLK